MFILKVKKMKHGAKLLVVSSNQEANTRVLEYAADGFTLKPMSAEMLTNKMLKLLAANRMRE
jgi:hypothetical protein